MQTAVSGAAWLGPDPRAALAKPGVKALVPLGWVGPEESELIDPLPPVGRVLTPSPAGTNPPRGRADTAPAKGAVDLRKAGGCG
eukprot:13565412-Alexandrium_andersonii.AAC.1